MKTKVFFIVALIIAFACPISMFAQTYSVTNMTNPDPNLNTLQDVWGIDNNNMFAVGDNGTFLKYNGSVWTQVASPSANHLRSVWASSANDVWAVGDNATVLHYNGSTLTQVIVGTAGSYMNVLGFSANNVYICNNQGSFYHYNGSSWSQISHPYSNIGFMSMSGGSNDLYLTGADFSSPYTRRMFHYDGANLTEVTSANVHGWYSIWSPDNNIFYMGGGELYRYNKTTNALDQILTGNNIFYGFSATNILVTRDANGLGWDSLVFYNGSTWTSSNFGQHIRSIYSPDNNPHNVFFVGAYGSIYHVDITSDVPEIETLSSFNLYPNPSNGSDIHLDLGFKQSTRATIVVLNSLGQEVQNIYSGESLGKESLTIDGSLPAGVYFIRVNTANGNYSRKLLVTK